MPEQLNQRFDLAPLALTPKKAQFDTYMVQPLKKTDEGFLVGRAIATNIGVFPYTQADGTTRRELRLPEEVRKAESLDSLKMKPLTLDHPRAGIVKPETAKGLSVGSVGDDVRADSYHVSVPISVTDKDAIAAVSAGKTSLSCGYTCDLEHTPGNWMGIKYDAIQRNIRYNHLAIVDAGRAGDAAKMHMDSNDLHVGVCVHSDSDEESAKGELVCDMGPEQKCEGCKKADGCKMKGKKNGMDHTDDSHEVVIVDSGVRIDTVALGLPKIKTTVTY